MDKTLKIIEKLLKSGKTFFIQKDFDELKIDIAEIQPLVEKKLLIPAENLDRQYGVGHYALSDSAYNLYLAMSNARVSESMLILSVVILLFSILQAIASFSTMNFTNFLIAAFASLIIALGVYKIVTS